jgi:hypothetical protein
MGSSSLLAHGIHSVNQASKAFAATQAAYRFFHNPHITMRDLAAPLLEHLQQQVPQVCDNYVLVIHDWSQLMYTKHSHKSACKNLYHDRPEGYELQSALGISDRDGLPIAPVALSLRTSVGVYCSRYSQVRPEKTELDELDGVMRFIEQQRLTLPAIHIIDAQADSVMHYREWNEVPNCSYLVRAVDRYVQYQGVEHKCSAMQSILQESGRFKQVCDVSYKGKAAVQYVAEAPVRLIAITRKTVA